MSNQRRRKSNRDSTKPELTTIPDDERLDLSRID